MHWPQWIYLAFNVAGIVMIAGKEEVTLDPRAVILTWVLITLPLLLWGGFFG